ncbi:DUF262 domain-containing protein [Sphingobacterium sp. BS-2]|uniref:DUF262 domain-containing protein n=1 Tax=Sphingobacterium sp. BS-2 TaxID=3377129 RepID=UPI0038FD110E
MNNKISIKTIGDLLKYNFYIPSFQRGYRWTGQQVTDLLNDINEFSPKEIANSDEKTWYCLQPIVVKQKSENKWDVIDGQQRLTTIYLILYYLNQSDTEKGSVKLFELEYETREGSANYLRNELGKIEIDDSNIDYFHISIAYQTIKSWFQEKKVEKSFEDNFKDCTKIIWFETSKNEDSIDIFTRINSGKIPLTNAELIKALFLNSSNFANADTEKLRLKQLEIASEWDRIEYSLQDDSFWYFINKGENNLETRIEFIFNLMSNKPSDDKYSTFYFFNKKFNSKSETEINDNWQEIKIYFQTLEEWFYDRELYHKIGYLITTGTNIKKIINQKREKTKTAFLNWINNEIQFKYRNVNFEQIKYNDGSVREILLLHNIQSMLKNVNETNRFPFDKYKKEYWDVEHIHAIATDVKVNKENQVDWLKNNFVYSKPHQDKDRNNQIEQIIQSGNSIDENEFDNIIDYVLGEEDNSLQNLCLLDRGTNRSYKNDSFKEKRKKIIQREIEGTFIPICTKNVFMKYYSSSVKDIEVWNENDKRSYLKKIKEEITEYLPYTDLTENEQ